MQQKRRVAIGGNNKRRCGKRCSPRKKKVKINRNKYGSAVIKIDAGSADILEQFANEAGLPISQVASNFIKYASEHTIIKFD